MRPAALAGALLLAMLAGFSSSVHDLNAQFAGRVAGAVTNGTAGGTVPEGFEVVLVTTDLDGNPKGQQTAHVDAKGAFEFTNVASGDEVLNRVVTDYQGVISTIRLEEEVAPANLQIKIFETTRSLDSINIVTGLMVARPNGPSRIMGFLEFITFRNDGDRTFVADLTDPAITGLSMLRFGLPENYERLEDVSVDPPLPAGSLVEVGPGFALTNPIPPGEYKILFAYLIRYEGNTFEFGRNLPFGAKEMRVLIPKGAAQVSGNGFAPLEEVTLGKSVYSVTGGGGYGRGDRIDFKFTQLPEPSLWQSIKNRLRAAETYVKVGVPVAAGVVMAGLIAYVFLARRRSRPVPDAAVDTEADAEGTVRAGSNTATAESGGADTTAPGSAASGSEPPPTAQERETLVREIALLDQRFESGEIEESAYRTQRAALSARALGESPPSGP